MDIHIDYKYLFEYDVSNIKNIIDKVDESIWDVNTIRQSSFVRQQETKSIIYVWTNPNDDLYNNVEILIKDNSELTKEVWSIAENIKKLYNKDSKIVRLILAKLGSKKEIQLHADIKNLCLIHRVHLPIKTNLDCIFHINKTDYNLQEGKALELNNQKLHSVKNNGTEDRIHLICDILEKETLDNIKNIKIYDKPWWK
jgi:hypothetical protein